MNIKCNTSYFKHRRKIDMSENKTSKINKEVLTSNINRKYMKRKNDGIGLINIDLCMRHKRKMLAEYSINRDEDLLQYSGLLIFLNTIGRTVVIIIITVIMEVAQCKQVIYIYECTPVYTSIQVKKGDGILISTLVGTLQTTHEIIMQHNNEPLLQKLQHIRNFPFKIGVRRAV